MDNIKQYLVGAANMRTTRNLSITMPLAMIKDAERLAKREHRTMSELVREALRHYAASRRTQPEPWEIQQMMRIIAEAQSQQKEQPLTPAQLRAESKRLARGTAKYARPDLTEEDVVRIIHEHRADRNA
jgi:metal-responsive CopG/Arc/MetJ family transcriptional regulator